MQPALFNLDLKSVEDISNPDTYKGISSFHKYWGKKPIESIAYFIQNFTKENDIVLDPFLGSGLISRECLSQNRRFIGIDLNPFAIEHSNFLINPPSSSEYIKAFELIESKVKNKINNTYLLKDGNFSTHYL
jgi:DNA modification methylase